MHLGEVRDRIPDPIRKDLIRALLDRAQVYTQHAAVLSGEMGLSAVIRGEEVMAIANSLMTESERKIVEATG